MSNGIDANGMSHEKEDYNFVDNLYLHSLIQHGIIYTASLVTLATTRIREALREGSTALAIVFAAIAFQATSDGFSLSLNFRTMRLALVRLHPTHTVGCNN